jgi:FkbM family methyltransferase
VAPILVGLAAWITEKELRMNARVDIDYLKERDSLRRFLGQLGIYERVKASWIYDLYWWVAGRRIIDDRRREIAFYRNLLVGFRKGDLIFDVGANVGLKVDIFLRMGAKVVAAEPDDLSREILRQRFLKYRLKRKPLVIVGKAVSEKASIEKMWINAPGSAFNTLSNRWVDTLRDNHTRPVCVDSSKDDHSDSVHSLTFGCCKEIETVSVEELFVTYGVPFFIKIDVEGHELSVLRGMRRPVPYLSFEVNLPEFRQEGLECVEILRGLVPDGEFNYTSNFRLGLMLSRWARADEFCSTLRSCRHNCIEVFWRTAREVDSDPELNA